MKRTLALIALLISAPTLAVAQDIDPKFFASWDSVNGLLRSKNVNPTSSNWAAIESMCLPVKTTSGEVAYNQCRYEKAYQEYEFTINFDTCKQQIEDRFPDSLLDEKTIKTITKTDPHGRTTTYEESVKTYNSRRELDATRRDEFTGCMQSYDWKDADDWRAGREAHSAEPL